MSLKLKATLATKNILSNVQRVVRPVTTFYYCINPFAPWNSLDLEEIKLLFGTSASDEINVLSKKQYREIRERASFRPSVPQVGFGPTQFNQKLVGKDGIKDPISQDLHRLRNYFQPPLTVIIYICCAIIATAPNRDILYSLVQDGQPIPNILIELSKKIRESETNDIQIKMGSVIKASPKFKTFFEESFFDVGLLRTPSGFTNFLGFCQYLFNCEENYIKMETFKISSKDSFLPRLNSGNQTTFCAITSIIDPVLPMSESGPTFQDVETQNIQLLPNNCYSGGLVSETNVFEAMALSAYLSLDVLGVSPIQSQSFVQLYTGKLYSISNLTSFIILRVTGQLPNSSGMPGDEEKSESDRILKSSKGDNGKESFTFSHRSIKLINKILILLDKLLSSEKSKQIVASFKSLINSDEVKSLLM